MTLFHRDVSVISALGECIFRWEKTERFWKTVETLAFFLS